MHARPPHTEALIRRVNNRLRLSAAYPGYSPYRPWKRRTAPPDISAGSLRSPGIGYQLKQISADRIDGHRQADSREQVFGIGPGVMYSQGRQTLFANLYAESGARNRSEGNQLTLRYLLAF